MSVTYTYWTPIVATEHFLAPGEIANAYGLLTEKGKPHARMAAAICRDYALEKEYPLFYYAAAGKNMNLVFPEVVYKEAMSLVKDQLSAQGSMAVEGVNYKYMMKES